MLRYALFLGGVVRHYGAQAPQRSVQQIAEYQIARRSIPSLIPFCSAVLC
jgi:hypothetical protein